MRVDLMYFYMALVSLYAGAIYAPSLWAQLAQAVLSALVAVAFWQKAFDHMPYLLEPSEAPPPRLSLADGLVAAMGFLTVQTFVAIPLAKGTDLPLGERMLIAFTVAGAVVALAALFFLRKIPGLFAATGIVSSPDAPRPGFLHVVVPGVLAGTLAGLFGLAYIAVVNQVESLRVWKESFVVLSPARDPALFAMVVLAAPLFEEFIFRGLIYRGMERSLRPAFAVVGSAAVFAVVHPPVSVIPVFVLGIAAALSFRWSRLLWTPMITHMIYNALVVSAEWIL
jgi:ABC-2 type transport system permease protein